MLSCSGTLSVMLRHMRSLPRQHAPRHLANRVPWHASGLASNFSGKAVARAVARQPQTSASRIRFLTQASQLGRASQIEATQTVPPDEGPPSYIHALSQEQLLAVFSDVGSTRVVAGPGSGKTRVLTSRIAHLIHHHSVPAPHILAITFTIKAAQEMRKRLVELVGEGVAKGLKAGTFHSFCVMVLRRNIHRLKGFEFDRDFSIYDEDGSLAILKKLLAGWEDIKPSELTREARELKGAISRAKSKVGTYPRRAGEQVMLEYFQIVMGRPDLEDFHVTLAARRGDYFDRYQAELAKNNALDFDDLLAFAAMVLKESPEALEQLKDRFRHVLVDEFQDTNSVQYDLVKILGGGLNSGVTAVSKPVWRQRSVFVVGDPDQSIYSWRGAEMSNMVSSFQKDFPASELFFLRDNYRSSACILELSQQLINNNNDWDRKALVPKLPRLDNLQVACLEDDHAEAEFLGRTIKQLIEEEGHPPSQIAVLVRMHKQFRLIEQAMVRSGVKYVLVGGTPFWRRTEVLDVLAYLRLAVTLRDAVALDRVINTPKRKLGDKTVADLKAYAKAQGLLLSELLFGRRPFGSDLGPLAPLPSHKELGVGAAAAKSLEGFREVVWQMRHSVQSMRLGRALTEIMKLVQYEQYVSDGGCSSSKDDKIEERLDRLEQLVIAAKDYEPGSLMGLSGEDDPDWAADGSEEMEGGGSSVGGVHLAQGFLNEAALYSSAEEGAGIEGVRLATLHATKGLEFETVFMSGCCDRRHPLSAKEEENVREERRLFYVGMTRAKQRLVMSYPMEESMWGKFNTTSAEPSRFLQEALRDKAGVGLPPPPLDALTCVEGTETSRRQTPRQQQQQRRRCDSLSGRRASGRQSRHPSLHTPAWSSRFLLTMRQF